MRSGIIARLVGFHLGKPIAVLIGIAAVAGVASLLREAPKRADLTLWTFAESHARSFRGTPVGPDGKTLAQLFEDRTGKSVDVKLINNAALNVRLNTLFDRAESDDAMPDLAEIEISFVGAYFRPPSELVGFMPLNGFLERSPRAKELLPNRLKTWSKDGQIFGIPHDLHPVSISYRDDLFREAGIDLSAATTWPDFHAKLVAFTKYWAERGEKDRYAIELSKSDSMLVVVMLMQQGVSLISSDGTSNLTDPRVARTVAFYAQMVAGEKAVAMNANPGPNAWASDIDSGRLCAIVTPDWRAGNMRKFATGSSGKMRMMPLPRFAPTDAPTASWGGTMIGIPRRARDPEMSWKLIEHLYLSPEGAEARKDGTLILPPNVGAWADPIWHAADPYFGGQKVGELYIDLAKQMPPIEVHPYRVVAQQQLTFVVSRAVREVEAGRIDGLEKRIAGWLKEEDVDLRRRIAFGTFTE
jgi:arabinosaccharide transport system substrate-binding protein